jgi:hypothetical protein
MQHNITSITSVTRVCRVCRRTFHPPEVGRPQVYCSQACRQSAYRARGESGQTRIEAAKLRRMLSLLNHEFTVRSGNLAAAIDRSRAGTPNELPTGWEIQISRTAHDLREMLDHIQHLVNDHSQLAYRHRIAMKRLGSIKPSPTSAYTDSIGQAGNPT